MIKTAARGAAIGLIVSTTQALDIEVFSKEFCGILTGVVALGLLIEYALPSSPETLYTAYQPGDNGQENGFYLCEDNSTRLQM